MDLRQVISWNLQRLRNPSGLSQGDLAYEVESAETT